MISYVSTVAARPVMPRRPLGFQCRKWAQAHPDRVVVGRVERAALL